MEPLSIPLEKPKKQGDVYKFSNGASYRGSIRNGKMHGHGMFEDSHGSRYTGDWKDGKMHGEGVCETVEGERYSGSYFEGVPHGRGKYSFKNGNVYEGEYAMGKIHGKGTIRFPDNRRFEGDFVDNKKHGRGRYEGNTGVYEGEYSNGKKDGFGIFTWIDGSKYEGNWKNDLMHDKAGKKTEKDGRMFSVEYVQGKLIHANPLMDSTSKKVPSLQKLGANNKLQGSLYEKHGGEAEEEIPARAPSDSRWWIHKKWDELRDVVGCGGDRHEIRDLCGGDYCGGREDTADSAF
uniref:MORN repeat-containing protein 5 n=1 Tax=Hanusia phi TaxID=3032 RepID=A0A7S0EHX5_9CRYP|mmetsp:Transcript_24895/g.56193  ORF Transcript_24895/g.56193 Transcript_24895/m.56193 type:complete len:291 (+) Transcript_24895:208-1080(+)